MAEVEDVQVLRLPDAVPVVEAEQQNQPDPPEQRPPDAQGVELETLTENFETLKKTMEAFTKPSVNSLQRKIMALVSRPGPEFNKYEALELVDSLKNAAHDASHEKSNYYRIAYETLRDKVGEPSEYFRALVLSLLGDKDHEKVLDRIGKVEKCYE